MDFTNREIATYFWLVCSVLALALIPSTRKSLLNLVRIFCHRPIITVLVFALIYVAFFTLILKYIEFWTFAYTKITIQWTITFALVTTLNISRAGKEPKFFSSIIKESLALTGLITFVMDLYSFSLAVELIAIPLIGFVVLINAFATQPQYANAKRTTEVLLATIGLGYFLFSLYRAVTHLNDFSLHNVIGDLLIPILLTIGFVPFLYMLHLYMAYERSFIGIKWAISDPILYKNAKFQSLYRFGFDTDLLQRWVRSIQLFNPKNKVELDKSFDDIKLLKKKEENPLIVPTSLGWSPYLAKNFLAKENLTTRDYHRSYEDEWCASSNYLEVGDDLIKNNIAYYINGTEDCATQLILKLNVNSPQTFNLAEQKFQTIRFTLVNTALGRNSNDILSEYLTSDRLEKSIRGRKITITKNKWHGGIEDGYSRTLNISVINDSLEN